MAKVPLWSAKRPGKPTIFPAEASLIRLHHQSLACQYMFTFKDMKTTYPLLHVGHCKDNSNSINLKLELRKKNFVALAVRKPC